mmetsp:Transcript_23688/g.34444  ORF Transcript_23688/g.34444 Transcript_23688/m.34444 type:complete len:255 (-) Transcript_23688:629-1393(-)
MDPGRSLHLGRYPQTVPVLKNRTNAVPRPNQIPLEMLKVNGMSVAVTNAGIASIMSSQSMFRLSPIIIVPIKIRIGAVATWGTSPKSGARNRLRAKKTPVTSADRPVRAPSLIPAAVSTPMMMGVQPSGAAMTVPMELATNPQVLPGVLPSSCIRPAREDMPKMMPDTSNIPMQRNAATAEHTASRGWARDSKEMFSLSGVVMVGHMKKVSGQLSSSHQQRTVSTTMPSRIEPRTWWYMRDAVSTTPNRVTQMR